MTASRIEIIWTEYMSYRTRLRGFDFAQIEHILRHSGERYVDTSTGRFVAIGRVDEQLALIPYESDQGAITPVTVHATTRQQINFRIKTGRFVNE